MRARFCTNGGTAWRGERRLVPVRARVGSGASRLTTLLYQRSRICTSPVRLLAMLVRLPSTTLHDTPKCLGTMEGSNEGRASLRGEADPSSLPVSLGSGCAGLRMPVLQPGYVVGAMASAYRP